jgi:hypothetical protein
MAKLSILILVLSRYGTIHAYAVLAILKLKASLVSLNKDTLPTTRESSKLKT